eukprot:4844318-Prymnesium_polylepis.1
MRLAVARSLDAALRGGRQVADAASLLLTQGVNTGCVNTCGTAGVSTYQHLPKSGVSTPCTNSLSTLKREP